jgi:hypothetical protein
MEHSTVLMISDAPEFVEALFSLNDTILQEAVRARLITADELDVCRQTIREAKATLPTSLDARNQRLRRVLGFEAPTPSDGSESGDEVGVYDYVHYGVAEGGGHNSCLMVPDGLMSYVF